MGLGYGAGMFGGLLLGVFIVMMTMYFLSQEIEDDE